MGSSAIGGLDLETSPVATPMLGTNLVQLELNQGPSWCSAEAGESYFKKKV